MRYLIKFIALLVLSLSYSSVTGQEIVNGDKFSVELSVGASKVGYQDFSWLDQFRDFCICTEGPLVPPFEESLEINSQLSFNTAVYKKHELILGLGLSSINFEKEFINFEEEEATISRVNKLHTYNAFAGLRVNVLDLGKLNLFIENMLRANYYPTNGRDKLAYRIEPGVGLRAPISRNFELVSALTFRHHLDYSGSNWELPTTSFDAYNSNMLAGKVGLNMSL